jgi:hypothetical protein
MSQDNKVTHYSSKMKASMQTKMQPEFDENGNQTETSMLYGTIDKGYLTKLLVEHREKMLPYKALCKELGKERAKDIPRPEMDPRLARIIRIVIEKTLGSPRFSGYTMEWKEEFREHALLLALNYIHNYDPSKTKTAKSNDPYNYIRRCVKSAFFQKWETLNTRSEMVQFVPLDEGILHSCVAFDQYAGMVKREKQRRHWSASANAGLTGDTIEDAVQKVEKLDKAVDDDNVLPEDMEQI